MSRALILLGLLAASTTACGGSTGGGAGGAGTGGGSSNTSSSSSGVINPAADGAYFLSLTQTDPTACKVPTHDAAVGMVDAATRGQVITNGTGGTKVTCEIQGTTSFNVHGKIDDTANTGNYFEIVIASITPDASEDAPAPGDMTFVSPQTAGGPLSGDCSFYFTPGTPETVATGKVWLTFRCPALTGGQSTCPVDLGYAIFENCLTQ